MTNAATVPVRVRLFGTPMIEVAHAQPAHLLERHDAALLAIIATEGPQDRARVAPLLWPDAPVPRSHLRQRLHRMKREVGRSLLTSDGPLAFLPDVEVDVRRLEMDLRRDDSASRGALLGDLDYSDIDTLQAWVDRARISESARRADLLAQLSSELEDRRLLAGALRYAQRIVFDSPTLEHGHRRLMWLHYLRGDRAAALDAYARCGVILLRDVDQEPDAETQALARLIAAGRGRPSIVVSKKTGLTRPPRMVGRDAAWRAFAQSRADQAVLLVRGDAGIGKSRVLEELALSVEGAIVAGALPGDSHFAYGTLSRILEAIAGRFDVPKLSWVVSELSRIVPAFGAAPSDALDARRIGRAFASALDGWRQQGLQAIFVDDLQYADDASVEALVPQLSTRPTGDADLFTWVLAARSQPPEAFERWYAQSIGRGLTILDLVPLDAVAIHELLRSLAQDELDEPRWIAALLRHAGGNPLFVLETVRAIELERDAGHIVDVDAIPRAPNVADLIDQRLSLLSERARHLTQVAAIAGQNFEVAIAAQVMHCAVFDLAAPWAELEAANVLSNDRFAHDLIFERALRSIPDPIARSLHGAIASALADRGASSARVAEHWLAAEAWADAAEALAHAARDARTKSRRSEELDLWTRCATAYDKALDPDLAFHARCQSCEAMIELRPTGEVVVMAGQLCEAASNPGQRLDALLVKAAAHVFAVDAANGLSTAQEALSLATDLSLSWQQIDAARYAAMSLGLEGRGVEGERLLARFAATIEQSGNTKARMKYRSDLAYLLALVDKPTEAIVQTRRAIDDARALNDRGELLTCVANLAALCVLVGRHDDAATHSDLASRLLAESGDNRSVTSAVVAANAGAHFLAVGRFADAIETLERSIEICEETQLPNYGAVAYSHLAHAYLLMGQPLLARNTLKPIAAGAGSMFDRQLKRACIEERIARQLGEPTSGSIAAYLEEPGKLEDRRVRFIALLDLARTRSAGETMTACDAIRMDAQAIGHDAIALRARLFGIEAMRRGVDTRRAAREARAVHEAMAACAPADLYLPEAHWILLTTLEMSSAEKDRQLSSSLLETAFVWIRDRALSTVPPQFRTSFLRANPVNVMVLQHAANRLDLDLH